MVWSQPRLLRRETLPPPPPKAFHSHCSLSLFLEDSAWGTLPRAVQGAFQRCFLGDREGPEKNTGRQKQTAVAAQPPPRCEGPHHAADWDLLLSVVRQQQNHRSSRWGWPCVSASGCFSEARRGPGPSPGLSSQQAASKTKSVFSHRPFLPSEFSRASAQKWVRGSSYLLCFSFFFFFFWRVTYFLEQSGHLIFEGRQVRGSLPFFPSFLRHEARASWRRGKAALQAAVSPLYQAPGSRPPASQPSWSE